MYYDFHTQKFEVEKKAHFYCKSLAVLPNGIPIVVTENGDLYLFMKRADAVQTEMVRVLEPTGYIHIQSVSVATDVEPENAVWERLTVWGVSDQEDTQGGGFAAYSGYFDMTSGEPVINWKSIGSSWDRVALYSEAYAVGLNREGHVYMFRA